jgi:Tfp pilus assembly protein PilE
MPPGKTCSRPPTERLTARGRRGLSLSEIIVALGVLAIGILTVVGYITTIHRAAREGKNQAMATMHARSILEKVRDSNPEFQQALTPAGYQVTREEVLLEGEELEANNEAGRRSPTVFQCQARATHLASDIYSVVVRVNWQEHGRPREVVLESRAQRPAFWGNP